MNEFTVPEGTLLVRWSGCNKFTITARRMYIPINLNLINIEKHRFVNIKNINPNDPMYAIVDLESNGTEITELGIVVFNRVGLIRIYHEYFAFTSKTHPSAARFVHTPLYPPNSTFLQKRAYYTDILRRCEYVMAKGISLESEFFPDIYFYNLEAIPGFPSVNNISAERFSVIFLKAFKYLRLTKNQEHLQQVCPKVHYDTVSKLIYNNYITDHIHEIRHNPAIECITFWYILNNINPNLLFLTKQ